MSHCIDDNIDPHWISFLFRETLKIKFAFTFALPSIAKIRIVARNHAHPIVVIEIGAIVSVSGRWVARPIRCVTGPFVIPNGWALRLLFEIVYATKNRMI